MRDVTHGGNITADGSELVEDYDKCSHDNLLDRSGIRDLTNQDLEQIIAVGGIWAFLPWQPGETDASIED